MKLIALAGGIASGKSSVAQALARRGYVVVEHADLLKRLLMDALAGIGVVLTLEEIRRNKARYRTLLQELGTVIGFDSGDYVVRALVDAGWDGTQPAVIDNVRTDAQASVAKAQGFTVVRLNVSNFTRWDRLQAQGVPLADIFQHETHPIEHGLSQEMVDVELSSDAMTPETIAEFLMGLEAGQEGEGRHVAETI